MVFLKVAIKEKGKDLLKFKRELNISCPVLIDENASVAKDYAIWSHPTSIFLNREGKIVGRKFGATDWTSPGTENLIRHILRENK